ncbi:MAG TPA: rhodanese-like domain-containing protein [Candidatus Binatia bacterium]
MTASISCRDTAALMASDSLYAVLDIRERGEFNARQIANATSLPRSEIEFRIAELVPNRKIPIVVYDDDGKRAELAATTLAGLGYSSVAVLEGGLPAWQQARLPTASGVNVPSKAFGEHVHHDRNIPEISPEDVQRLKEKEGDVMILDMRTPEEFGRFCIPGAINVPGGDVVLWADQLKEKPATHVIVNCAGRTRGIIGTAALRRLGLNNARALKNGTMGWVLAGFELESRPVRQTTVASEESRGKATALALRVAEEEGIPFISARDVMSITKGANDGLIYLIDVRSEAEYGSGHLPGSLNIPGGQAVQRADDFIAVRNGKIIFVSNTSARAVMAAYWYRQMGFKSVAVLQGGLRAGVELGESLVQGTNKAEPLGYECAAKLVGFIDALWLEQKLNNSQVLILDVSTSLDFEAAHIPGAWWISRGWLELKLPERFPDRSQPIVLTCRDGRNSVLAAQALGGIGYTDVAVLRGGLGAWASNRHGTETGLDRCLVEANDIVLSPSIRGNKEEMQRYLEWELKLTGG